MKSFIVWEPSNSRSATLAREFGATVHYVHFLKLKQPWLAPFKYVLQSVATFYTLVRERPSVVFVQNPPPFAPLAVWLYCTIRKAVLIIDSHTGVFLERKWRWLSFVNRFVSRRAAVNIVTNRHLGAIVEGWGGRTFEFPDVPTEFPDAEKLPSRPDNLVTVINTFSYDEPLAEVLEAARRLPNVEFRITGDVQRCPPALAASISDNVSFTGFVSRAEYVSTVFSSDAAIVLTTENHTMQRGAYEAMSMEVPVITSDWPLLRETFFKGTVHVDNTADSIEAAVREVLAERDRFKREVGELKAERRRIWADRRSEFDSLYLVEQNRHAE